MRLIPAEAETKVALCVDWQLVGVEKLPADEVRRYMTAAPVTVTAGTTLQTLAWMMIDARIHRVIVIDEQYRPIGMVSSTDVLTAVAYAHGEPQSGECLSSVRTGGVAP